MLVESRGRAPLLALATAASVVALTATAPTAEAGFVIDDFSTAQTVSDSSLSNGAVTTSDTATPNGLARELSAEFTADTTSPGVGTISNDITGFGAWSYGARTGAIGTVTLTYDNLGGLDLSGHPLLTTEVLIADATGEPYTLSATLTSGSNSFSVDKTFDSSNVNSELIFALADFEPTVDTAAITKIEFSLTASGGNGDAVLGQIAAVPLPGGLPLFLGGLAGVGYVVRRRQRPAEAA